MDLNKPVIVTALYNIGRDKWNNFTQSYGGYCDWMERLLVISCNKVIYTDQSLYDLILSKVKKYDSELEHTKIVVKPLEQLECYQLFYDRLSALMYSEVFKRKIAFDVPEMTKPLYNIIMFNKVSFLEDCATARYFDNDLLLWVDAACFRGDKVDSYIGTWPNKLNFDKITFFSHSSNISIYNPNDHLMSQTRFIQGGCFIVPSMYIRQLTNKVYAKISECIDAGYIGSDEKIFDLCYIDNPSNYKLITCDWRQYYELLK